jgi:uncharacterized membrane protein (UPF0127 family)
LNSIGRAAYAIGSLFIALIAACPLSGNRSCPLRIIDRSDTTVSLAVEIADTEPLRVKGLMDRKEMRRDQGMIFIFDHEQKMNFWMKNTFIPLSIAYIGADGIINEIYDMKPLDISVTYPSIKPARYALEVNRGWFETNNISKGCRIVLDGCISK